MSLLGMSVPKPGVGAGLARCAEHRGLTGVRGRHRHSGGLPQLLTDFQPLNFLGLSMSKGSDSMAWTAYALQAWSETF